MPQLVTAQVLPLSQVEALPDRMTKEVPPAHSYVLKQHGNMCVATAVIRGGERMLELKGYPEKRYVVAWTHFSGEPVRITPEADKVGMYGSDVAYAISNIGFLRWCALPEEMQKKLELNPLETFGWEDPLTWARDFERFKDKTDKFAIVEPTNMNEIALCLQKGLPVLFISTARWRPVTMRNADGLGNDRVEFATTQFNTNEFHVVCLHGYYTLPIWRDGQEFPVEYTNLINSWGEEPHPLKMIWLDWVQQDRAFSCFAIFPHFLNESQNE